MQLIQLFISMLLFLVLFFGIAFLINMLFRQTWPMSLLYPLVVILIIDNVSMLDYVLKPAMAFSELGSDVTSLALVDILILLSGFIGTIVAGVTIRTLRQHGYQMF